MLGSPAQERHGHAGVSPVKVHKDDEGAGASDIWREAERPGSTQPGEEEVQGDPISVYKYLMEEVKKTQPDSSQWCPVKEQEATDTN